MRDVSVPRLPVTISLGCHVEEATRYHVDPSDPLTCAAGAMKRVGRRLNNRERQTRYRFQRFVIAWLRKNLIPLSPDVDLSVETWLATTSYTEARKAVLREKFRDLHVDFTDFEVKKVKGFVKDETYECEKYCRWIMSRSDEFKALYGPWIKAIEKVVYELPCFIKHVPEPERPAYIAKLLERPGALYLATDYTAFEAHFIPELMKICEFQLYAHMTKFLPGHLDFMRMNFKVVGKRNNVYGKTVSFKVAARMSGEMSTSLGNGFSNLMMMLFVCHENGNTEVCGIVEGDDGLFVMNGTPPTAALFGANGMTIKLAVHERLNEASFCGMVFDEVDSCIVTDPIKFILNFGWTSRQYQKASDHTLLCLLRAKCMSALAQYPGCPIVKALADYGMRCTGGISERAMRHVIAHRRGGDYEREREFRLLSLSYTDLKVSSSARALVARNFGIPEDVQIEFENYLQGRNILAPIELGVLAPFVPACCFDFWSKYVFHAGDLAVDPFLVSRTERLRVLVMNHLC